MKLLGIAIAFLLSAQVSNAQQPEINCAKDFNINKGVKVCNFSADSLSLITSLVKVPNCECADGEALDNIIALNLSGRNLTEVPIDALSVLKNLKEIDISNNQLPRLQIGAFKFAKNLEVINFANNLISKIEGIGPFAGMTNLKVLDLSGNQLTAIPFGAFQGLNLVELNLSSNQIAIMDVDAFRAANILSLNLSKNQISTIPAGVFEPLSTLQKINISENILTEINIEESGLSGKATVEGVKSN